MSTSPLSQPACQIIAPQPPRLLDQVAQAARQRGASEPTTAQLVSWVRAFILFHGKRHPRELGLPDATRFLEHVVRTEKQPLPALETARSLSQCVNRESILAGAVLGLAGPGKKISGIMPCTVIRPGDMADNILDRNRHPESNGERTKLVYAFPSNERPCGIGTRSPDREPVVVPRRRGGDRVLPRPPRGDGRHRIAPASTGSRSSRYRRGYRTSVGLANSASILWGKRQT